MGELQSKKHLSHQITKFVFTLTAGRYSEFIANYSHTLFGTSISLKFLKGGVWKGECFLQRIRLCLWSCSCFPAGNYEETTLPPPGSGSPGSGDANFLLLSLFSFFHVFCSWTFPHSRAVHKGSRMCLCS